MEGGKWGRSLEGCEEKACLCVCQSVGETAKATMSYKQTGVDVRFDPDLSTSKLEHELHVIGDTGNVHVSFGFF